MQSIYLSCRIQKCSSVNGRPRLVNDTIMNYDYNEKSEYNLTTQRCNIVFIYVQCAIQFLIILIENIMVYSYSYVHSHSANYDNLNDRKIVFVSAIANASNLSPVYC